MLAAFYLLLSIILLPVMITVIGMVKLTAKALGTSVPWPLMLGLGVGFVILLPLIYGCIGFVAGIIGSLAYNLIASWIGGFEVELEPATPPPMDGMRLTREEKTTCG